MGREVDRRDWAANRVTPARQEELRGLAAAASRGLPGAHEVRIEAFEPATGNPSAIASALAEPERDNHIQRALDHVRTIGRALGLAATQPAEYVADPHVQRTSSGAATVHLQQQYKGIPIFQAAQAVRFAPDDRLTDTAGSTVTVDVEVPVTVRIPVQDAALAAARHVAVPGQDELSHRDQFGQQADLPSVDLSGYSPRVIATFPDKPDQPTTLDGGPFGSPIKADLAWFPLGDDLRLAWQVVVTMPEDSGQFRVLVDAQDGEVLFCRQLMHSLTASGNVFLPDGSTPRQVRSFPLDLLTFDLPIPPEVLPFPDPWVASDSTVGNCVRAHLGVNGAVLRGERTGDVVTFNPASETGDDQKVLNIFFFNNFMHDYTYLLGFREADGNFQADNLGRGGTPGDAVDARAHSGRVNGTANMATPPDGSSPVMNMGLVTSSNRHTAMDASVVFHEYMHGVTNRLVGGRMNASALEAPQSVGMGEGWSDYIACTILGTTTVGGWVVDDARGIRNFPYDGAFPDHFGKLGTGLYAADPSSGFPQDEHNVGEIWCAALLEMNRRLDADLGAPGGRHLSIQLVVDALKLSPALPSFLDMRDAILRAVDNKRAAGQLDADRHARARHAILATFARFGMGPAARCNAATLAGIVADFTQPPDVVTPGPGPGPGPAPSGNTVRAEESPDVSIPDSRPNGVSRELTIPTAGPIRRVSVDLEIRHPFVGDLVVSLIPPGRAPIVLHNRAGGGADDLVKTFRGEDTPALAPLVGTDAQGTWALKVADVAARDVGSLKRWAIELDLASVPQVASGEASPALAIPDANPAGVRSTIAIAGAGTVGSIKVGLNLSHTFIGDLKVELVSPTGRRAVLHDRKGGGNNDIVSTFDSSTSPGLAALAGEPVAGQWALEVRDLEAADVGRLNRWSIELTPQP
jgi:extracellular elastinolytic metalloproteinase